jgi:hypothetical protein
LALRLSEGLGLMERYFCKLLCPGNRNAMSLVKYERVIFRIAAVQYDQWARAATLNDNVSGSGLLVRIQADSVAHPAEESLADDRLVVRLLVAVEAALAQRHPDAPEEGLFDSMDGNFQNCPHESIDPLRVRDGAEVLAQGAHLRLLFVREGCVLVGCIEAEAWRSFMDLAATGALECEDCRHVCV